MAALTPTNPAGRFALLPLMAGAGCGKSTFLVNPSTLMLAANSDAFTFADIPAGTIILGASVNVTTAGVAAGGTCPVTISVGGVAITAGIDALTKAHTGGANAANAVVLPAASTAVATFDTATADCTVNPVIEVTLYFIY